MPVYTRLFLLPARVVHGPRSPVLSTCVCVCVCVSVCMCMRTCESVCSRVYLCICIVYVLLCLCVRRCARVANYIYIIQLSLGVLLLSCVSQLLNLNMQRGCHRTPRAIRLIAEESYLSHERLIALLPLSSFSWLWRLPSLNLHFGDWFCNMCTVSNEARWMDGWMSYRPLPSSLFRSCDIQCMCVLLMLLFFSPIVCSRVLAVSPALSRCSSLYRNAYTQRSG